MGRGVAAWPESEGLAASRRQASAPAFRAAARTVRSSYRDPLRRADRKRRSTPDSAAKAVSPARLRDESEAAIPRSRGPRSLRQRFRRRERIEQATERTSARACPGKTES